MIGVHWGSRNHVTDLRNLGWIRSASAAAAVAVLAIGAILVSRAQLEQSVRHTTASHQTVSTVAIHYTPAQLQQVKMAAETVGVTPWIPTQGLTGEELTIVKNGGKGSLILDYKNIFVSEGTSAIAMSLGITSTKNLTIGNVPAEYITAQNQEGQSNSFLYFSKGWYLHRDGESEGGTVYSDTDDAGHG